MSDQEPIRTRSWLFTPATCPERFAKAAEAGADVVPWHPATNLLRGPQRSIIWRARARVRSRPCVSTDLIRAPASPISMRFVRGAYASKGGKSIIATRSTAAEGKISRIVPRLEGPVTTPRIDTHYVVTEFGSANLKGLSSTERAHALIGLAHPQFREELTAAAKKLNLI